MLRDLGVGRKPGARAISSIWKNVRQWERRPVWRPMANKARMSERSDAQHLSDLGLAPGTSFEAVKKQYRRLAMSAHPDRTAGASEARRSELEEKFKVWSVAYAALERRDQEGRWNEPWTRPNPWEAARPDPRDPRPPGASAGARRSPSAWGFSFEYGHGTVPEVAARFFQSYIRAAARVAQGEPGRDRGAGVREIANAYLSVFELYTGLTRLDLYLFQRAFLKAAWAQETPGVISVLSEACSEVARRARGQDEIIDAVSVAVTLFKPALIHSYFSVLDEIATPRSSGSISASALRFHEEIARHFKPAFSPVEAYEKENADFLKRQSPLLFAQRLLRSRPELFAVYHKAGWLDLNHAIYAERKADIYRELLGCEGVSWATRSATLRQALGLAECARLLASAAPDLAKRAMPSFEAAFMAEGRQDLLPERLWTEAMSQGKRSEALYWQLKRKSVPSWMGRAAGWLGREPGPADRAFQAVAAGQLDRLELALSDFKSSQGSLSELERLGAPLAQFVAWRDAFEPGDEAFCAAALDSIKSRFGVSALRAKDPFGACALDWMSRKISASAEAFERSGFGKKPEGRGERQSSKEPDDVEKMKRNRGRF